MYISLTRVQGLKKMCNNVGVVLINLPPYSLDFNPIDEAFAELKQWLKNHYVLVDGYESFDEFLELALTQLQLQPGNHFRSCNIEI